MPKECFWLLAQDSYHPWAQLSVRFEHHTVFARMFVFPLVLNDRARIFQVQGSRVILGHSRTNVLDPLLIVAFCATNKISDCSPRPP